MQPTQITLFHLFYFMALPGSGLIAAIIGSEQFGAIGAVLGGIAGLAFGHFVGAFPDRLATRLLFRKVKRSSDEELWKMVDLGLWNFTNTLALLYLAARGQEVRSQLPRIIRLLESENRLERVYGWDALRLVFNDETAIMKGYDPRGALEDCQRRAAKLKA